MQKILIRSKMSIKPKEDSQNEGETSNTVWFRDSSVKEIKKRQRSINVLCQYEADRSYITICR